MADANQTYISEFPGLPTITARQKEVLFFSALIVLVVFDLLLILSIFNPWSKPSGASLKARAQAEETYSASFNGDKPSAFGALAGVKARHSNEGNAAPGKIRVQR